MLALSAWPLSSHELPTLSIVQDPFIPDPSQIKQRFAQPIVFFRLDFTLSRLVHSPTSSASLKYLRIRIPARAVAQPLSTTYPNPLSDLGPNVPPSIELLDVSTCSVLDADIDTLLVQFKNLKHLILDGCVNLLRGGEGPGMGQELEWWSALGKRCALVGVKRAREKEKEIKAWFESQLRSPSAAENQSDWNAIAAANSPKAKRGRKGLATATISLRASTPPLTPGPSSTAGRSKPAARIKLSAPPKIQIVPPFPTLISLSLYPTTVTNPITRETRDLVMAEFTKGWRDGMRVFWERRGRLGASFVRASQEALKNNAGGTKVRFLKFKEAHDEDGEDGDFEGLEDVKPNDPGMFSEPVNEDGSPRLTDIPVLCIGGLDQDNESHRNGCGHSVSRGIWANQL